MGTLIQIDRRRRIALGAMAKHTYYLAEERDNGVIVLTPAVVRPVSEVTEKASDGDA